jgi:N-terminal domain on NACHT_NTPase and P-loop NTPases
VFRTKAELPVLLDALRQTKAAIDAGYIQDDSKKALIPAVQGCGIQIQSLDDVIVKVLPASGDSTRPRSAVMASRPSKED